MKSRVGAGLAAILCWAVAVAPSKPADAQAAGVFVLVKRDAFLYAQPDEESERVRDPWSRRFAVRIGPFWVMRRVAEQGDWVEVATIPAFRATEHCYETTHALDALDMHFFVRRDAIAPVLARRVQRRFDDGTSITLVPGVGLVRRGGNNYDAHVRGATIRLRLSAEEIATAYQSGAHITVSRSSNALLEPGASIELGEDHRIETEEAGPQTRRSSRVTFSVGQTQSRAPAGEPPRAVLAVEAPNESGNRARVTVRNDCLEAVGFVRRAQLTMERPHRTIDQLRERRGTALRPGTQLTWPDGTPAGRATSDAVLEGSMRPDGARMCFDHPLRPPSGRLRPDDTITVCAPRASVAQRGR